MSIGSFLFGKKAKTVERPLYRGDQQQILNSIIGMLKPALGPAIGRMQSLAEGDPQAFEAMELPVREEFERRAFPQLREQFRGEFGEGSLRSSGYRQTAAESYKELENLLAGQRIGTQTDAMNALFNLLGTALTPMRESSITPRQPGIFEQPVSKGLQGLLEGIGSSIGGRFFR